jgi:small subunit ribosomal protein S17
VSPPVEEPAAEAEAESEAAAEPETEVEPELEVAAEAEAEEAEPAAGAEDEGGSPASASAPAEAQPKPKKKRLPRAQRPQRTKKTPAKPATRKPIVRLEKPDHERGRRQERQGRVVSSAMDKTIVVKVDVLKAHPKYKKVVRRSSTFHAHDETNQAHVGDIVRIVETRPLSKTKRWRLAEVVEAAR